MKVTFCHCRKTGSATAMFRQRPGYGYNDDGRETLEQVYADTFHTEAALVRPQITCGTHALAIALFANVARAMNFCPR